MPSSAHRRHEIHCNARAARYTRGSGQFVFTANADGSYTMAPVTTAANEYGYFELTDPSAELRTGKLVVKGAYSLLAALKNSGEE